MIELYLDTADVEQVARLNACLPLRGVTTNPSILANSGRGVQKLLPALAEILGASARFHVQVVSQSVAEMVQEARQINALPYDIVVKVPATEIGLAAIKKIKTEDIQVLATAIYTAEQGFFAALCGADYLAPYVNRIHSMGVDGIAVVADLQQLLDQHSLQSKILAASFKSAQQATAVMKLGIGAITLPVKVVDQMLAHPAVQPAVEQFSQDWQKVFAEKKAFES
jgi:fructose-6-phosphate aldolase 1